MPKASIPVDQASSLAYLSLGSNLGDCLEIFQKVIERIQEWSDFEVQVADIWRTSPLDCPPDSPTFWNTVLAFLPRRGETPETLLEKTQALEKEFGRQPKKVL